MRVRILGCGTSTGVPRIGNHWGECDPEEPRNRRTRCAILVESGGQRLLVDCGPDIRQQLLAADVGHIDALIVTHDHADHCHGIDELRAVAQNRDSPVPVYARGDVLTRLRSRFGYIFAGSEFYRPVADPIEIPTDISFGDARIRIVDQPHGQMSSVGIRIDEGGRSLVYAIDFARLTDRMRDLYRGADVWISDCLSRRPHPTHAHLGAVLDWARDMNVGRLLLSHLSNSMDYQTLVDELPDWAAPAHDGLEIHL